MIPILIKSSNRWSSEIKRDGQLRTWIQDLDSTKYSYFYYTGNTTQEGLYKYIDNILSINMVDSYRTLTKKLRHAFYWTLENYSNFSHLIMVDDDIYLNIFNLSKLEIRDYDCIGKMFSLNREGKNNYHNFYDTSTYGSSDPNNLLDHPMAGFVILSKRVVESFLEIVTDSFLETRDYKWWIDDMVIGDVLNSVNYSPSIKSFTRNEMITGYTEMTQNYYKHLTDVTTETIAVHMQQGLKNYSQILPIF